MKILERSMALLAEAIGRDGTIDCLLRTGRPPNEFEREMLTESGCTFLTQAVGNAIWVRFRSRDANLILNLGFVDEVEVVGNGLDTSLVSME